MRVNVNGGCSAPETGKEQEVQVLYDEDVASHIAPRPCVVSREGRRSVGRDHAGWPSSHESGISERDRVTTWKATRLVGYREWRAGSAWSETPACMDTP